DLPAGRRFRVFSEGAQRTAHRMNRPREIMTPTRPRIVIIGAGFGGLAAAKQLARAPVDVTVIDRHNYHLFQPLLYQVATARISLHRFAAFSVARGMLTSSSPRFRVSIRYAKKWSRRAVAFGSTISSSPPGPSTLISGTIGRLMRRA